MLWEPRVIESGRETVEGLKEDENWKRRVSVLSLLSLSWFSVIHVFMSSVHAASSSLRGVDIWSCASSTKSWWFIEWLAMISERGVVYRTKRMGPSTEPWGTLYMSCDGEEDELLTEVDWYLSEKYDWNHWNAVDWMPKTEFSRRGEFGGQQCQKLQKDPIKEEQRSCHCSEQREYHLQPWWPCLCIFAITHTLNLIEYELLEK